VNEGKKRITMPMIEAMVRSLAINAVRGHLRSQQAFTKMLAETERTLALQKKQFLETMLSYKLNSEDELERRSQLGISGLQSFLTLTTTPKASRATPATGAGRGWNGGCRGDRS
jgi:hypothetical protein